VRSARRQRPGHANGFSTTVHSRVAAASRPTTRHIGKDRHRYILTRIAPIRDALPERRALWYAPAF
jgi:hypothetical protein